MNAIDDIRNLRRQGMTFASIMKHTGVSRTAIQKALKDTDLEYKRSAPRLTQALRDQIVELRKEGLSSQDIAQRTIATKNQVRRVCKESGLSKRGPYGYVLTQQDVDQVATLRNEGKTYDQIEAITNLHRPNISECLRRAGFELKKQGRRTIPCETKAEAVRLVKQGMSSKVVGDKLGIHPLTVRKYYRLAEEA